MIFICIGWGSDARVEALVSFAEESYITHYLGYSLVSFAREVYEKNKFEGDTLSHIIITVITSLLARGNSVNTCVRETENNFGMTLDWSILD